MKDSIDFITKAAGTGNYANVDASKIAAAGMSCGGLEAYANAQDPRVKALGIFNSGEKSPAETQNVVPPIKKPIFYFLGGTPDIAYENVSSPPSSCPGHELAC
jgi:dienelactone hydrolase